jgi:hypothetical protein
MMNVYGRTVKQKVAKRKVEGASNWSKLGLTSGCGDETRLSTCAYTPAYHHTHHTPNHTDSRNLYNHV